MKILTAAQMRRAEEKCAESGTSTATLMENAGRAVAATVRDRVGDPSGSVLVVVGGGNNGGDGEVAARYLGNWGYVVTLYMVARRPAADRNLALAIEAGAALLESVHDTDLASLENELRSAVAVVDAVFGTGFVVGDRDAHRSRPLGDDVARVLHKISEFKLSRPEMMLFAVDMPSGLDADTGAADPACLTVDESIVLGVPKPGLFNLPGAEKAGRLAIVDIGIPSAVVEESVAEMITADWVRHILPLRPLVSNKGTFGKVMVLAGSRNYVGAAWLACSGAMRVGAGLVTLAIPASLQPGVVSKLTEATYLPLPEPDSEKTGEDAAGMVRDALEGYDTLLVGPGLGRSEATATLVRSLLFEHGLPHSHCVIDADALNILAESGLSTETWRSLGDDAILTPHPGEMGRLLGKSVKSIQEDRLNTARQTASMWNKTVILKGAYSVVASPDGRMAVSPFANPVLASAGTGDVLAGAVAGFLAQGLPTFEAALAAVYIHGAAGENVRLALGDAGALAGDLLPVIPVVIHDTKRRLTGKEESHAVGS